MLPYSSWFFDTSKATASTHHRTQVLFVSCAITRHCSGHFGKEKKKSLFAAHGSRAMMLSQKNIGPKSSSSQRQSLVNLFIALLPFWRVAI